MTAAPDSAQITQIVTLMRGAVSALAADVRALPPACATYKRTMPHLRRAAAALGMSADSVGDDPTMADIRRAAAALAQALRQARAGAARLIAAPESAARALGVSAVDTLREAGAQLRATVDRIESAYTQGSAQFFRSSESLLGGIGGGLAMVLGILAIAYVISKRK